MFVTRTSYATLMFIQVYVCYIWIVYKLLRRVSTPIVKLSKLNYLLFITYIKL